MTQTPVASPEKLFAQVSTRPAGPIPIRSIPDCARRRSLCKRMGPMSSAHTGRSACCSTTRASVPTSARALMAAGALAAPGNASLHFYRSS